MSDKEELFESMVEKIIDDWFAVNEDFISTTSLANKNLVLNLFIP